MKNFEIGDIVSKKSGKPFKSGDIEEKIVGFAINKVDPKQREAAIFEDESICNLEMLNEKI